MHEDEPTERDQREQDVSPNVCPPGTEVPETDMFLPKTLTVSQERRTNGQAVSKGAVDMSEQSSQSDDGVSVSEYCAEKVRSLSERLLQTSVEVGEESILQILGGASSSVELQMYQGSVMM